MKKSGHNFLTIDIILYVYIKQDFLLHVTRSLALFAEMDEICFTMHVAYAQREHAEERQENFLRFRIDLNLSKMLYSLVFVSSFREV